MKHVLLFIMVVTLHVTTLAQGPVSWSFTATKTAVNTYELHMAASVADPWHIYSQFTPVGGPLATKVKFTKNPLLTFAGKISEVGTLETRHEEVFGVDVRFFSNTVDFIQVVTLKTKLATTVSGTLEFMACNDQQCLPPKKVAFSVKLK